ncbi:hypothetical protein [Bradyrhizobium betae]|uniref:hypothetical protein n=1 Tax=Bradyrhizobium betae TaxID=244734 RepID=UPI001FE00779|nr:hypothetical protein [Bradyrhizobium betae]
MADVEILESNPGAVEDGDIVPRGPARTAAVNHRADCIQNEIAAFDPVANMLGFSDLILRRAMSDGGEQSKLSVLLALISYSTTSS